MMMMMMKVTSSGDILQSLNFTGLIAVMSLTFLGSVTGKPCNVKSC